MSHPSDDMLLLLAYGELDGAERDAVTVHLASCEACGRRFDALERARVAADWALGRPARRRWMWPIAVGTVAAAAAALALMLGWPQSPPGATPPSLRVPRYSVPELVPIDSMLTQLEQEHPHGVP